MFNEYEIIPMYGAFVGKVVDLKDKSEGSLIEIVSSNETSKTYKVVEVLKSYSEYEIKVGSLVLVLRHAGHVLGKDTDSREMMVFKKEEIIAKLEKKV